MKFEEIKETKKRGLIAGYEPNRISLYILMLGSGRNEELLELLYNDMEKYKISLTLNSMFSKLSYLCDCTVSG